MLSVCQNLRTEETESYSLNAIQANINELREELREGEEDWAKEKKALEKQIADLEALKSANLKGVDTDRLMRGKAVVSCQALPYYTERWASGPKQCDKETREKALRDAIERIPSNYLDHAVIIVKQYSSFDEQREDCDRGRCPRHGSVRMWIGLKSLKPLAAHTEQEKSDAMYYLAMILSGKAEWDELR